MARNDPQVNLRIPEDLKDALAQASSANTRTLTAEIVARLRASFEGSQQLPASVQVAIAQEVKDMGWSPSEALANLALLGQAQGGQLVNLRVGPGTSMAKLNEILTEALRTIPANARTVVNLDATGN